MVSQRFDGNITGRGKASLLQSIHLRAAICNVHYGSE